MLDSSTTLPLILTLPECHKHLEADLHTDVPSLITLKRWSAGGQLDAAKRLGNGTRHKYAYDQILRLARAAQVKAQKRAQTKRALRTQSTSGQATDSPAAHNQPSSPQLAAPALNADVLQLDANEISRKVIEDLTPALSSLLQQAVTASNKQMIDAISSLDAARRSLMLKYDSQVEALRTRNEELVAEIKRLRPDAMDQTRANALMMRIVERLDRLERPAPQNDFAVGSRESFQDQRTRIQGE